MKFCIFAGFSIVGVVAMVGWLKNIVKIYAMWGAAVDAPLAECLLRVVGVVCVPLGSVLGFL